MNRRLPVLAAIVIGMGWSLAAAGHHVHIPTALPGLGLVAAFLFGLLGSTHCLGMCGPLVGLYASQLSPGSKLSVHRQHFLFNLGRTLAYTNAGILCGAAGFALRVRPWAAAFVGIAVGLFVLAVGARLLGVSGAGAWSNGLFAPLAAVHLRVCRAYVHLARSPSIVLLGALHSLLPCPLLYVMFTSAVALGDPVRGGVLLFAFGFGTVPMVWGTGALGQCLSLKHRLQWHRVFGWTVAAWGVALLIHSLQGLRGF